MAESKTYTVERTEVMGAPPEAVYPELVDFHRWSSWSPWEDLDPEMHREYAGPDSGVGATYAWSGNRKAGSGRMEIIGVDEPSSVVVDLRFVKPFKSTSVTTFTVRPEGDGSRVTWSLTGPATLATRVMGVFTSMDKLIGPDFEKGLTRLRAVAERRGGSGAGT